PTGPRRRSPHRCRHALAAGTGSSGSRRRSPAGSPPSRPAAAPGRATTQQTRGWAAPPGTSLTSGQDVRQSGRVIHQGVHVLAAELLAVDEDARAAGHTLLVGAGLHVADVVEVLLVVQAAGEGVDVLHAHLLGDADEVLVGPARTLLRLVGVERLVVGHEPTLVVGAHGGVRAADRGVVAQVAVQEGHQRKGQLDLAALGGLDKRLAGGPFEQSAPRALEVLVDVDRRDVVPAGAHPNPTGAR